MGNQQPSPEQGKAQRLSHNESRIASGWQFEKVNIRLITLRLKNLLFYWRKMLLSKEVKTKWNYKSKEYYENKGYKFTKYRDDFTVSVADLIENSHAIIECKCDKCGMIKRMEYRVYKKFCSKNDGKYFCHTCANIISKENNISNRQKEHIKKILERCKVNGYTLLSTADDIKTQKSYIRYSCPTHGEHKMRVMNFEGGKGCPQCALENARLRYQFSRDEIITKVKECNGKILNADDYINVNTKNLKFECMVCGNIFVSSLRNFTQYGGQVCPDCSGIKSLGERRIEEYLQDNNIEYIPQHWFNDCRDINPLPFDFYIPNKNTIIEFDGRQHFEDTNWFTYSLETTQKHDSIKNEYCELNNINLIRINYKQINHINEILDDLLVV